MRYYPIQKNWSRKIKPHLQDLEAQYILRHDFNRYTFGRWHQEFKLGMKPTEFESCDWRCGRKGRQPEFHLRLHSTTWDGKDTLFDMNFLALGVAPDEAWQLASENGIILEIGERYICNYAQYWKDES
jgi:hypothetical protein